jgi:hypothetical protein
MDNIIMVLEHKDRIYQIDLCHVTKSAIGKSVDSDAGHILTELAIWWEIWREDGMQCRRMNRLGWICNFYRVPFPKLLLFTPGLVTLSICNIPHSGYNFTPRRWFVASPR